MGDDAGTAAAKHQRLSAVSSELAIDVRSRVSDRQIPLLVDDDDAAVLAALGRTEDLVVSPDGSLVVVAGFNSDQLSLIHFRIAEDGIEICDVLPSDAEGLLRPHGLAFLDDVTLLVANRESELSLVRLDDRRRTVCAATVLIDGSADVPVRTPGSVATRRIGDDLTEVFVCNNYAHDVTRYVLDGRRDWSIIDGERLLAADLDIPDGVAISANGEWIAISNHNRHAVYVYRYDDGLAAGTPPTGVLRGVNYPHGLAFASGDRHLVVADAGLPNLSTFESADGDWSGERIPWQIDRVMDEASFHRGRYNPQEGGPKGLEIVADRIVVVTSEFQPLAFFALHEPAVPIEQRSTDGEGAASSAADLRTPILRLAQRLRDATEEVRCGASELGALVRERDDLAGSLDGCRSECDQVRLAHAAADKAADDARAEMERVRRHHADAAVEMDRLIDRVGALEAHVDAMYASTSWRWSAPLRACSWLVQRGRSLRR